MTSELKEKPASLHLSNIGGVSETDVEFFPGVTMFTGENATNKTSIFEGLCTALGGDQATVKSGTKEGRIHLKFAGTEITRTLQTDGRTTTIQGDPYLDTPKGAELFAFLLENNPARRAIREQTDLREIVMGPIDVSSHREQIESLQQEKRTLEKQLEQQSEWNSQQAEYQAQIDTLRTEIDDLEQEIDDRTAELEAAVDDASIDAEISQQETGVNVVVDEPESNAKLDKLQKAQEQRIDAKQRIEVLEETLGENKDKRDMLQQKRDEYQPPDQERVKDLESEVESLRSQIRDLDSTVMDIQSVIQQNEEAIEGGSDISRVLSTQLENREGEGIDRLSEGPGDMVCWTCGSPTSKEDLEQMLDLLREYHQDKRSKKRELEDRLDELNEKLSQLRSQRKELESTKEELQDVRQTIERNKTELQDFRDRHEELEEKISELESEVQEQQQSAQDELLSLQEEVTKLESKRNRKKERLASVQTDLDEVETKLSKIPEIQDQLDTVSAELQSERGRIKDIQETMVANFNEKMETLVDILEFENIERLWIERLENQSGLDENAEFELHVTRTDEEGRAHQDLSMNLSESEREVTGIVFALSGFLAHDVAEDLPMVVIDSVEALDSGRITKLVEFLEDQTEYLLIALLPEDAQGLTDQYEAIVDY